MPICEKCLQEKDKTYSTFGKRICKECLDKRKRTGKSGNSGMIYNKDIKETDFILEHLKDVPISLVRVKKSNPLYVKWFIEHYPKSKGIVGRQLNYLIYRFEKPVGIIGFASPPLNYKKFNLFFDLSGEHSESAKLFLNNNVFRIVYSEANIGTQILRLARNTVFIDYKEKYASSLLGLVTFIEPPRTGAMYKADNWLYIGETEGVEVKRRGAGWIEKQYITGIKKLIYGYKYSKKYKVK